MIWKTSHDWIEKTSFSDWEQTKILLHVIDLVKKKNSTWLDEPSRPRPLVVFDLDSTLFEVAPRTLSIAKEYAREQLLRAEKAPELAEWWLARKPREVAYTLAETAAAGGFPADHPEGLSYMVELERYWRARFFADEYLMEDLPAPGAAAFVRSIADLGVDILYLTGRHAESMSRGTLAALEHWGFPLVPGKSELAMKPKASLDDAEFKGELLGEIAAKADVVAFFDNEPANFSFFWERFPGAELIVRDASCAGTQALHVPLVHRIGDFIIN